MNHHGLVEFRRHREIQFQDIAFTELIPRIAVLQRGTLRILCSGSTGWARQRCALRRAGCVWFVIITEPDRSEDKQKSATYANLVHVLFPWVLKPFAAEPTPSDVKSSG